MFATSRRCSPPRGRNWRRCARGVSKAEAANQLDPGPFRERYLTTPMRRQAFEQFFVKAAIAKAWPK